LFALREAGPDYGGEWGRDHDDDAHPWRVAIGGKRIATLAGAGQAENGSVESRQV
jgi:hypothetical protein